MQLAKKNIEDKSRIKSYAEKIQKMLKDDPDAAKKAAIILEKMLNNKK